MACTQTFAGIDLQCTGATGGVKRVLIANFDDVTTVNITNGKIDTITMAASAKFKEYRFRKNTAYKTSTANFNDENGTRYVSTEVFMRFSKLETSKRTEMQALFNGQCAVIVETQDGTYWYLGYNNPVTMTAGTAETGTNMDDFQGYTATMTDLSQEFPHEIDASIISGIL